jgi:exodeoxyribonuclease VII small subunit
VSKTSQKKDSPSITEQMTALSELVEQLEDPEIELEAALVLYEKGVKLSSSIQKTLESAEQRVAQVAADGSLLEEDGPAAEP